MTLNAAQLLNQLEPAVRPGVAPARSGAARGALETQSFEQLLSMASRGQVDSGRQIETVVELEPPLDPAQLERLAAAADQAEAAGSRRALMMIDGRAVVLDVRSRSIVGELNANASQPITGIDAALFVGSEDDAPLDAQYRGPDNFVVTSKIAQQIEKHRDPAAARQLHHAIGSAPSARR
jgi:hypothetical protein